MAELSKNEKRNVSVKKVENGFIVTLNIDKENSDGTYEFTSKQYVSTSASESSKFMESLMEGNEVKI